MAKVDSEMIWLNDFANQTEAVLADDKAAQAVLRDTAKWLIGGVALTTGGLVAGSTLSSLGSLGLGGRLLIAVCAVSVGVVALIVLLTSAIRVLEPRTYDWHAIWLSDVPPEPELTSIVRCVEATMIPKGGPSLKALAKAHLDLFDEVVRSAGPVEPELRKKLISTGNLIQRATSHVSFEHSRLMFAQLKRRLLVVSPIVAVSLGVFSWAANPSKNNPSDIPPVVKQVEVISDDAPAIQRAMASPACFETKLTIVALREWRSGAQDVVTIPRSQGQCTAITLRLDHGRLSPIR